MKHVYRITLLVLAYTAFIVLYNFYKPKPEAAPAGPAGPDILSTMTPEARRIISSDPYYDRLIAERVNTLVAMAEYREKVRNASRDMLVARHQAATRAHDAWSLVIKANLQTYAKLLQKAQQEPKGRTVCTICDGSSYVRCVMCQHDVGKCITCLGSGRGSDNGFCPACSGKGKCYLCNGTGKMFCPFCDDGMIRVGWFPPRGLPPLE